MKNKLEIMILNIVLCLLYQTNLSLSLVDKTPKKLSIDAEYTIHRFFEVPRHPAIPLDMESFLVQNDNNLSLRVHNNRDFYDLKFNIAPLVKKHFRNKNYYNVVEVHYGNPDGYKEDQSIIYLKYYDDQEGKEYEILPLSYHNTNLRTPKKLRR
ncbi:MAG TPA: hypothetical protein VJ201_07695 [Candidatus Babeliales bacterium]|nr:hypothetical protein [Candidatus Babeliales bacterium]